MTEVVETDAAVVGAGVAGLLVADELVRAGVRTLVLERGPLTTHSEQLDEGYRRDIGGAARPNHDLAPGARRYPWTYIYAVGGSTLRWAGVAPRFLPSDFELRSRYGVGRDWPFSYEELAPFYAEAERALAVAAQAHPLFPGSEDSPFPPHPFSPADEYVRPLLEPYLALPQARPTVRVNGRPRCVGDGDCGLCRIDARYSALHTLDDRLAGAASFTLRPHTLVARLQANGTRVQSLQCLDDHGDEVTVRARHVVLAANGIENAGLLLRSGIDDGPVGHDIFDHEHFVLEFRTPVRPGSGQGATPATGASYLYADGDWRAERGSAFVYTVAQGMPVGEPAAAALARGTRGRALREQVSERFHRTLEIELLVEDLPLGYRRVELSPRKDAFGLPLNRVRYGDDSPYLTRTVAHVSEDIERRLAPIGARLVALRPTGQGAHMIGTCRMGSGGVVDADLRHRRYGNLSVVGASAFPSYSAAHPTLTVAALAIRLGRTLARELA